MDDGSLFARAPRWLRVPLLCVAVWLAVRIVGNVTDSLTGIAGGGTHPGATRSSPPS